MLITKQSLLIHTSSQKFFIFYESMVSSIQNEKDIIYNTELSGNALRLHFL